MNQKILNDTFRNWLDLAAPILVAGTDSTKMVNESYLSGWSTVHAGPASVPQVRPRFAPRLQSKFSGSR